MSTPAAKRRRLDSASKTLSKPFVSPFKTPLKSKPVHDDDDTPTTATGYLPLSNDPKPAITYPSRNTSTPIKPSAATTTFNTKPSSATTDPTLSPLLKTQRTLETRLRALTTEIDTLSQALAIANSNSDADLEALIQKWKGASREAAEEVFGGVRDRVNRMGGVGAWREAGRRQAEWRSGGFGFDDGGRSESRGGEEEGLSEGERERRRAEVEDGVDGREEGRGNGVVVDEGEDDDTFTMDMMLRSLNVDLKVIGFDKESQRWID